MAKNSIEAYGASGKTNLLMFDPDALTIVTDEAHPLYDPRVNLPINPALVLNIMHVGVLEPVIICKNAETGAVEVVAGRQRVKAAREANSQLRARGCEPLLIPAVIRRAAATENAGVMVSENELRESDSPIGRAEKMRRLMSYGKTESDLSVYFGCTVQTVKATLALLDCTAAVRKAVEDGDIGVTHARELAKLEPAEQRAKLSEMKQASAGTQGHARARKQRQVVGTKARTLRSKKEILLKRAEATSEEVKAVLSWVLGEA
jgi:ParB family chromosome partitioning protein